MLCRDATSPRDARQHDLGHSPNFFTVLLRGALNTAAQLALWRAGPVPPVPLAQAYNSADIEHAREYFRQAQPLAVNNGSPELRSRIDQALKQLESNT
jgi:hypothetical protein